MNLKLSISAALVLSGSLFSEDLLKEEMEKLIVAATWKKIETYQALNKCLFDNIRVGRDEMDKDDFVPSVCKEYLDEYIKLEGYAKGYKISNDFSSAYRKAERNRSAKN